MSGQIFMLARDALKAVGEPLTLRELTLEMQRIKEFSRSSTPEGSVQMAFRRELATATRLNRTPEINRNIDGKFYLSEWYESLPKHSLARKQEVEISEEARKQEVEISEEARKAKLNNPIQINLDTTNNLEFPRGQGFAFGRLEGVERSSKYLATALHVMKNMQEEGTSGPVSALEIARQAVSAEMLQGDERDLSYRIKRALDIEIQRKGPASQVSGHYKEKFWIQQGSLYESKLRYFDSLLSHFENLTSQNATNVIAKLLGSWAITTEDIGQESEGETFMNCYLDLPFSKRIRMGILLVRGTSVNADHFKNLLWRLPRAVSAMGLILSTRDVDEEVIRRAEENAPTLHCLAGHTLARHLHTVLELWPEWSKRIHQDSEVKAEE